MVYIMLADGFEECEAVAPIDMLRRAGIETAVCKVGDDSKKALGSHGIEIGTDIHEGEIDLKKLEMLVLPGGADGVAKLYASAAVKKAVEYCVNKNIPVGAICAAPSIPARLGYLSGVRATAHPSFRHYLTENGALLEENVKVLTDGIFTTAAGAGVSIEFGLELVRVLSGEDPPKKIAGQILL